MTGLLDRPLTNERHCSLLTVAPCSTCVYTSKLDVYTHVDQHSTWQYYVHVQKGACSYGGPLCVAENIMCV